MKLEINLIATLAELPEKERKNVYDDLSTIPEVIENVVSQVIYGCTELGSSGASSGNEIDLYTHPYPTPLMTARRFVRETMAASNKEAHLNLIASAKREREIYAERLEELNAARRTIENLRALIRDVRDMGITESAAESDREDMMRRLKAAL